MCHILVHTGWLKLLQQTLVTTEKNTTQNTQLAQLSIRCLCIHLSVGGDGVLVVKILQLQWFAPHSETITMQEEPVVGDHIIWFNRIESTQNTHLIQPA